MSLKAASTPIRRRNVVLKRILQMKVYKKSSCKLLNCFIAKLCPVMVHFGLTDLLMSRIASYGVIPIQERSYSPHYIENNASFGAIYTLIVSSDLISLKIWLGLPLRSMENANGP